MATGEFTKNPQKADLIFVRDTDEMQEIKNEFDIPDSDDSKFILSSNMEYITGYLMQEGTPASGLKKQRKPQKKQKKQSLQRISRLKLKYILKKKDECKNRCESAGFCLFFF